jgi:N-methylhydantoinase B
LNGGLSGTPSWNIVNPGPDQKLLPVCPMSPTPLVSGDEFVHIQAGAGGHGDPLERNPQAVLEDVLDDLISLDYAQDVFGVIFQDGIVDKDATVAKRKALQTSGTHLTTYVDLFHSEVGIASSDWNAHEVKAGPL